MMHPHDGPLAILHCHSTFALGGKEARAVRLMNAWGDRAHHTILSAVPDQLGARDAIAPGIVAHFPGDTGAPPLHGKPGLARYRALARYFQRFDLILTYNWGAMDAVMTRQIMRVVMALPPLVHHEDGFNADEAVALNPKRNLFRRAALGAAHAVVVPSHRLDQVARDHWGVRAPLRIANGVALDRYRATVAAYALPGFDRRPGDVIVGTIAGLRAVKDLPLLVAAIAQTPPNVRLVIAGEGPERPAIEAAIAAHGLGDRVHMAGFVADPAAVVGLFDMMALSSLSEQQPIAVIEAMAAALPVVSPAVGDVPHMVAPDNAPFIVERSAEALAGAIIALARDPALRDSVGAANAARADAEFDERRMIARYAALYTGAMGLSAERLAPPAILAHGDNGE
jgi:glycosyltransferase involved in cell wall biosynthesis